MTAQGARGRRSMWLCALCIGLTVAAYSADSHAAKGATALLNRMAPAIVTVEYVQSTTQAGQKQQNRGTTHGVVLTDDGLVLVSGKIRFPSRGGPLPQIEEIRLHGTGGRSFRAEAVDFDNDLNLGLLRILDAPSGEALPHLVPVPDRGFTVGDNLQTATLLSEDYGRTPQWMGLGVTAQLDTPQPSLAIGGAGLHLLGAPLLDGRGRMVGVLAQLPMSPWAARQVAPELSMVVGVPSSRFLGFVATASEKARALPRGVAADSEEGRLTAARAAAAVDAESAWMGIEFQPLWPELGEHLGVGRSGGVVITRVVQGGPADVAGLRTLDVLTEFDGAPIAVSRDSDAPVFARLIRSKAPDRSITVLRHRAGAAPGRVDVRLERSPKSELLAERLTDDRFDYAVREITLDTLLQQRLARDTTGVVVDSVTRAGWAGLAELPTGVIVQRINDHEVRDLASWRAAMAAVVAARPEKVLFFVRFRRETRFYVAEPDWMEQP